MKHLLNIFCGLMLLFPFAANCQTNLKGIDPRDIKVENGTRYYYDEDDNKILHGWQFKDFGLIEERCYYEHGIKRGDRYYCCNYGNENRSSIEGKLNDNGKLDSIWRKSIDLNMLDVSSWEYVKDRNGFERWDNGILIGYTTDRYAHEIDERDTYDFIEKLDDETAAVYSGNVDGLYINNWTVTNVFLRQNGEFDELDEELKKLMDNYINTGDVSVFYRTKFRINEIRIYNEKDYEPTIRDQRIFNCGVENNCDIVSNYRFNLNYKNGTRLTPPYYVFHILTRIKFTPVEEIIRECNANEFNNYFTDDSVFNIFLDEVKKTMTIYLKEYKTYDLDTDYLNNNNGYPEKFEILKQYYIDPNDNFEELEKYFREMKKLEEERKRQEEERKRQEELNRKKQKVENYFKLINYSEKNIINNITDNNIKSSYQNIRSEYVKERYDTITEQDIELLKKFVVFSNKIDDLSKNEMATFNQNNVEIRKVASLLCADALPIYEKEISIESKPFDDINGLNSIIDEYKNKIKMQEDFLKFAKKRQLINETENSLIEAISGNSVLLKGAMRIATGLATGQDVADIATTVDDLSKEKKSGNKHLKKVYNEYKKSFDFSWSNNGDWAERLNTFANNQNKYLRCVSLLAEIESNDAKILEATKKLKRIKKAYSEYKETLNFETIPHSDDNKTLEEFVEFQTKVFQNINSKGEFVNDSLKKIKDLNEKKAILTK